MSFCSSIHDLSIALREAKQAVYVGLEGTPFLWLEKGNQKENQKENHRFGVSPKTKHTHLFKQLSAYVSLTALDLASAGFGRLTFHCPAAGAHTIQIQHKHLCDNSPKIKRRNLYERNHHRGFGETANPVGLAILRPRNRQNPTRLEAGASVWTGKSQGKIAFAATCASEIEKQHACCQQVPGARHNDGTLQ